MKIAHRITTSILAVSLTIIFAECKPQDRRNAMSAAGDVLNPEGRLREAEVARQATATAEAAVATAAKANEMAQANLDAAIKAKAEAEKAAADAKLEVAKATANLATKESSLPATITPSPTPAK